MQPYKTMSQETKSSTTPNLDYILLPLLRL